MLKLYYNSRWLETITTNINGNITAVAENAKVAQRRAPHEGDMGSNPIFSNIEYNIYQ